MSWAYSNGAEAYGELVCRYSKRGNNSQYKCRREDCKHHYFHVPDTFVEYYEWNPFALSSINRCPFYRTKTQMIIQNHKSV